ncbi:hypothetical protein HN873_043643 [Arachis hypogaea]
MCQKRELNLGRDRIKILEHELSCRSASIKTNALKTGFQRSKRGGIKRQIENTGVKRARPKSKGPTVSDTMEKLPEEDPVEEVLRRLLDFGKKLHSPNALLINGQRDSAVFTGQEGKTYKFRVSNVGSKPSVESSGYCSWKLEALREVILDKEPCFLTLLSYFNAYDGAPLHLLVITGLSSYAILVYLASAFTGIADHWYPTELSRRAKINSVMDWHYSNLRNEAVNYVIHTTLAPALGRQLNPKASTEAEKVFLSSLKALEDFWFNGDNEGFLCDSTQPSVADLSMVCELMQLEVLDERDHSRILSPYKKILQWIENTRNVKVINLWHIVGFVLYANQEEIVSPP